jgi:hypothetical protein
MVPTRARGPDRDLVHRVGVRHRVPTRRGHPRGKRSSCVPSPTAARSLRSGPVITSRSRPPAPCESACRWSARSAAPLGDHVGQVGRGNRGCRDDVRSASDAISLPRACAARMPLRPVRSGWATTICRSTARANSAGRGCRQVGGGDHDTPPLVSNLQLDQHLVERLLAPRPPPVPTPRHRSRPRIRSRGVLLGLPAGRAPRRRRHRRNSRRSRNRRWETARPPP